MLHSKRWVSALVVGIALMLRAGAGHAEEMRQMHDEAEAPMWWLGFQLYASTDGAAPVTASLSEAYKSPSSVHYGWGGGFTIPLGLNLYHGLGVRLALSTNYSGPPFDKATAQISSLPYPNQQGEQCNPSLPPEQTQHICMSREAYFVSTALIFDVQYIFPLLFGTFKPYLGAGPGIYFNYVFTDIKGIDFPLLDNQYNDPDNSNNIDPYSVNLAAGFNGYLGVNIKVNGAMHLNFEVAYDRARMDEAPLLKATDGFDARRAAYTYSVVRLSSGLLFNF